MTENTPIIYSSFHHNDKRWHDRIVRMFTTETMTPMTRDKAEEYTITQGGERKNWMLHEQHDSYSLRMTDNHQETMQSIVEREFPHLNA